MKARWAPSCFFRGNLFFFFFCGGSEEAGTVRVEVNCNLWLCLKVLSQCKVALFTREQTYRTTTPAQITNLQRVFQKIVQSEGLRREINGGLRRKDNDHGR